ncbi:MAG: glutamate racemase, partial [Hyphomonadaceae bacterium]|nr:glutamate racemase [Hyphomonadaceae bacterium]
MIAAQMVNGAHRVLVFDSGVGGLSVFDAIAASGHALELDYAADNAWLPYGLKTDAQLRDRVPALLVSLVRQWAPDIVVVACNTASTIALQQVRAALPVPVVGVVPPIKPAAAQSKTGAIGLLATPATVRRAYTDDLIAQFADGKRVVRFGSAALVEAAEQKLRGEPPSSSAITEAIEGLFGAQGAADIDVVALACTHFPLLAEELAAAAPRGVTWLDSGEAIARRVAHLLIAGAGPTRVRHAGFTDAGTARAVLPAFRARGFAEFLAISEAPKFSTTAMVP